MITSITNSIFGDTVNSPGPGVSIVVPCRNEADQIEVALKSIFAQELPPGGFEVIVADGMSGDGTRDILMRLANEGSQVRIVDNPAGIVSTGLNGAIRLARGKVIIRMDAHTSYAPDYVRRCVEVLRETAADNVGGPWVARGTGRIGRAIAAAFQSSFAAGGARSHDPNYSGPVDTVYLGCWPRKVFDRIGFFDEDLVRNQDDEFNLRLVRSGGKLWQSTKIKSWYHPRQTLRQLFSQYIQYGYWKVRVIQKHRLPASVRHLVPACFILVLIILPVISLCWRPAFWAWLGILLVYLLFNIFVSLLTAAYGDWKLFPFLPAVLATFHFAYGWGFLKGFVDFFVLDRQPAQSYKALTRPSREEFMR